MWGAEIRGLIAVGLVMAAIVFAWTRIENRETAIDPSATTTTTTTTTTTLPPTTTLSPQEAATAICDRSQAFVDEVAALADDTGPGPVAHLALDYWSDVLDLAAAEIRTEVVAVVNYYERYLQTAEPFDFNTTKVILEGDKEGLQQLLTRPAPGLETSRALVAFGCGIDVPDQPRMSARSFEDLEDRLLRPANDDD